MPSPFPGMDPYLEKNPPWEDVHDRLTAEMSNELNRILPSHYVARLNRRDPLRLLTEDPQGGIPEGARRPRRSRIPDVAVATTGEGSVAVAAPPRSGLEQAVAVGWEAGVAMRAWWEDEQLSVEVRESGPDGRLVTVIEILSPSNKQSSGPDRERYDRNRLDVRTAGASLVEIDLLRSGDRSVLGDPVVEFLRSQDPSPEYLVLITRSYDPPERPVCELFPTPIDRHLPTIPIPLLPGDEEASLPFQSVFDSAYDNGRYAGDARYGEPLEPPLAACREAWSADLLRGIGL